MNIKNILTNKKTDVFLDKFIEVTIIICVLLLAFTVNRSQYRSLDSFSTSDIFYEYSAAVNINNGINPYEKILEGNLLVNDKYATLFPLYYYFLLLLANIAQFSFENFMYMYRGILFGAECVAFLFTYLKFRKSDKRLLGLAAASFLILNRWAINNVSDLKQDMLAISVLMASMYFFDTKRRTSYFLYGLSLGIKHIGIFFSPIYLIPLIFQQRKVKEFALDMLALISPILLPSLPFMISNFKALVLSLLFSFTRAPVSADGNTLYGYEKLLVLYGDSKRFSILLALLPRLPLIGFSLLNMLLLFTKKIPVYAFGMVSILAFITFNPVYFDQYFLWLTPFAYYGFLDYSDKSSK